MAGMVALRAVKVARSDGRRPLPSARRRTVSYLLVCPCAIEGGRAGSKGRGRDFVTHENESVAGCCHTVG